jgi:hypothetical protein
VRRPVVAVAVWAFVAVVACSTPALACYSGLTVIPTTDVVCPNAWVIDIQWLGYARALRTDQLVLNTEVGLSDRFEMGVDWDATSGPVEHRAAFNAKYVFLERGKLGVSAALGVQNVNQPFKLYPYLVVTRDWGALRVHCGLQHEEGNRRHGFFGVDRTLGGRWQLMADHTTGEMNFTSAGVGWSGRSWQVVLGAQWPNAGGAPMAIVHVIFTGSFKGRIR